MANSDKWPADAVGPPAPLPINYLWNSIVLTGDASAYYVAIAFIDLITVLPLFFQRACESMSARQGPGAVFLTPSLLAALALAIRTGGWLVPPFFSARTVSTHRKKKPVLLTACWIGRLPFMVAAIYLCSGSAASHPALCIAVVMGAWAMFSVSEGFAMVPWLYIISHAIPDRRRGRMFGLMTIIGGVLACSAGLVVNRLMRADGPPFPRNFGILIGIVFLLMMVSQGFLILIREPVVDEDHREPEPIPMLDHLRQVPTLIRDNTAFRRMIIVQLVGSAAAMASALYTLFATQRLHLPAEMVGRFLSVSMVGTIAGSILWGHVNDHFNPRRVIRLNLVAMLLTPWTAFAVASLATPFKLAPELVAWTYSATFFLVGATFSGGFTGYTNYMIETAPPGRLPEYTGLMNTLNAPSVLMPIVGTWLASVLSPQIVFVAAGCGAALALGLSRGLPASGRHSDQVLRVEYAAPDLGP